MVNQNKGKVYEPVAVYDRKLARSIMKHQIEKNFGYHKVNSRLNTAWNNLKGGN